MCQVSTPDFFAENGNDIFEPELESMSAAATVDHGSSDFGGPLADRTSAPVLAQSSQLSSSASASNLIPPERRRALMAANAKERAAAQRQTRGAARLAPVLFARSLSSGVVLDAQATTRPVVPEWTAQIPVSHSLRYLGGIVFCTKCGGTTTSPCGTRSLLRHECTGICRNASTLRKLQHGRVPPCTGIRAWPDGARPFADDAPLLALRPVDSGWA